MLSRTKGQRIAIINEPDSTLRSNIGIMRFTGGDTFYARSLINSPFIPSYGVRPSYGKQSNGGA